MRTRIEPSSSQRQVRSLICWATAETPLKNSCSVWYYDGLSFLFFSCFLGLHLWHMKVPRLGVELGLQLSVYTTATTIPDLSLVFNLQLRSQQHWILNSESKARDWTRLLMDTSRVHYHWATTGTLMTAFELLLYVFTISLSGSWWGTQELAWPPWPSLPFPEIILNLEMLSFHWIFL